MKTLLLPSLIVAAGLVAGCGGTRLNPGHGHGLATGSLYRTAEAKVLEADAAAHPDAKDREVVDTEVVSAPVVRVEPYDAAYSHALPDSRNVDSGAFLARREMTPTYSKFVERWTVRHGDQRSRYLVTFQPGPRNEAQVAVAAEP